MTSSRPSALDRLEVTRCGARERRSTCCGPARRARRCSSRIRLKIRWRSQRSCCGDLTSGRSEALEGDDEAARESRDGCGSGTSGPRPQPSPVGEVAGGLAEEVVDRGLGARALRGLASGFALASIASADACLLLGHDRDRHLGDDLGVQVDAHRVVAEGLDAALEVDPPAVDCRSPWPASAATMSPAVTEP